MKGDDVLMFKPCDINAEVIYGECKFTNAPFDLNQFRNLKTKVFMGESIYYYLFSLSGFTAAVESEASNDSNIKLISAKDLV